MNLSRFCWSLVLLTACANHDDVGSETDNSDLGEAFPEPRRYIHGDDQPELPDFEVVFCPDGVMPLYFDGGGVSHSGNYEIEGTAVRVEVPSLEPTALTLDLRRDTLKIGEIVLRRGNLFPDTCRAEPL